MQTRRLANGQRHRASFMAISYLRKTPPRRLAFKHSGGDSRLCTSATVTLYLLVLLSNDNRPGTEQNTSEGCAFPVSIAFSLLSDGFMSATRKQRAFPVENCAFRRSINLLTYEPLLRDENLTSDRNLEYRTQACGNIFCFLYLYTRRRCMPRG